jgi:hypothetical protein
MSSPPRGLLGALRSAHDSKVRPPAIPKPLIVVPKPAGVGSPGKSRALPGLAPLQPIADPSPFSENAEQPTVAPDGAPSPKHRASAPISPRPPDPQDPPADAPDYLPQEPAPVPTSMLKYAKRGLKRPG